MIALPTEDKPASTSGLLPRLAYYSFAVYLALLLGTNSVAEMGGVLTWWPLWRLPGAGNEPVIIGALSLLPPISAAAWLATRIRRGDLRSLSGGWGRVTWPLLGLALLGLFSTLRLCPLGSCSPAAVLRLLLLLIHLFWVYLYVVNERVDLLPLIAVVVLTQAAVAVGQFVGQRDLGLQFLGESALDPQVSGISVVMRGADRWLRGYGFATHPNALAGTLVPLMLSLFVISREATRARRGVAAVVLAIGFAALLTTLSRWAAVCLGLGLAINLLPWLRDGRRSWRGGPPLGWAVWAALLLMAVLFFTVYGDAVVGRVARLDTPIETRSINERRRDTAISLQLIAAEPLVGAGLGNYLAAAREYDPWAELVHAVPLRLAAELGVVAMALWLWLVAGPVLRAGALGRFAPETGLWLAFWSLGLLDLAPNPLVELRSALLVGLVAALVARSAARPPQLELDSSPSPPAA